jgi:hypothetical protein
MRLPSLHDSGSMSRLEDRTSKSHIHCFLFVSHTKELSTAACLAYLKVRLPTSCLLLEFASLFPTLKEANTTCSLGLWLIYL